MRFQSVRLPAVAHHLPEEVIPSEALEARLGPLYERLGLHPGRIELMTGIRERRFFPAGTRPSTIAAAAGRAALGESGLAPESIGCLIHASVCRDFLEPATASVVHDALGLAPECMAFDLSNACLGVANAMVVAAEMIERGSIDAALVVAGENGRPLVDATVRALLEDPAVGKAQLKAAFASLTIGAGGAAVVLAREDLAPELSDAPRLVGGLALAATEHHVLCHGDQTQEFGGPLMQTDSEGMLLAGNELAGRTWPRFLAELDWQASDVDRVVTHQVGVAHRRMTLGTMGIDPEIDFPTVETLGNVGSVSLPLCLSMGRRAGFIKPGQRVAALGIGSGLHCLMLGIEL